MEVQNENVEISESVVNDAGDTSTFEERFDKFVEGVDKDGKGDVVETVANDEGDDPALQPDNPDAVNDDVENQENINAQPAQDKPFEPTLNYTYRGKKFDMPEELKGVIKTQEQQEFYNDIFTKAKGLEVVKAEGMKAQETLGQIESNLMKFYNSANVGDLKSAFEIADLKVPSLNDLIRGFGYNDKDLITLAYEVAQQSPEMRKAQESQSMAERRNKELEQRLNNMENNIRSQEEQRIVSEVYETIQDESIAPIAEAFDAKHGVGAFAQEITSRGAQLFNIEGRIVRPMALAKDIISRYNLGNLVNQPVNQSTKQTNNSSSQPARTNQQKSVPVIPAVESGGGSPGQRVIRSLDDVAKLLQDEGIPVN